VLLFDLGGVVIDCAEFTKILEWQNWTNRISDIEEKWESSETVERYRKGEISTKEFAETIIMELDLTVNISRFLREFRLLPKGFYPGADDLLKKLSSNYLIACISNTNEMHWNKLCSVNRLEKFFKFSFPSHLIHIVKPDDAAFACAISALKVNPEEIAFFDNRQENVDAALKAGMVAFKTDGFGETCGRLHELEVF
jgi:glucose-1-phosphatase